ncbi:MAG: 50S ribosomal protein L19e [Thermofilaceae archaeon]
MSTAATRTVKRLAASILKVGVSRIRIKPDALDKVETAITREDVKRLIKDGVIYKIPPSTPSRGRWRKVHAQRKKGRGRGPGSKKGPRIDEKRVWISRVRAQRRFLKLLKERGLIDSSTYRRLRSLVKGGTFSSVRHLKTYLKEQGILTKS